MDSVDGVDLGCHDTDTEIRHLHNIQVAFVDQGRLNGNRQEGGDCSRNVIIPLFTTARVQKWTEFLVVIILCSTRLIGSASDNALVWYQGLNLF